MKIDGYEERESEGASKGFGCYLFPNSLWSIMLLFSEEINICLSNKRNWDVPSKFEKCK